MSSTNCSAKRWYFASPTFGCRAVGLFPTETWSTLALATSTVTLWIPHTLLHDFDVIGDSRFWHPCFSYAVLVFSSLPICVAIAFLSQFEDLISEARRQR